MPVLGKREIVRALINEGFRADEAGRAYETILDVLEAGIRSGRTIYFRRIFKIWPVTMAPRRYWDNWNRKHIYFGERTRLKVKSFFLKDRNLPIGRKKIVLRKHEKPLSNGAEAQSTVH